jgi:Zn-dependent oligopeptidase
MEMVLKFRGRKPSVEPLLENRGLDNALGDISQ